MLRNHEQHVAVSSERLRGRILVCHAITRSHLGEAAALARVAQEQPHELGRVRAEALVAQILHRW